MKVIALSFILNVITVILPCIKHLRHSKEKKLSVKTNDTRQHPLRRNTKTNQVFSTPAYAFDLQTQAGWDYKGYGLSGIVSGGLECMEVEVGFVEWGRVVGTNREECIAVLHVSFPFFDVEPNYRIGKRFNRE